MCWTGSTGGWPTWPSSPRPMTRSIWRGFLWAASPGWPSSPAATRWPKSRTRSVPSRKSRIEAIRQWFGEIGAEPWILCETSNYVDAVALAVQGVGISIFPQTVETPGQGVAAKAITQPARQAEYVLVWNKGQRPAGLPWEFVLYVQDTLEAGPV